MSSLVPEGSKFSNLFWSEVSGIPNKLLSQYGSSTNPYPIFDKSGKLIPPVDVNKIGSSTAPYPKSGEIIVVSCYDWNYKTENEKNWIDHLRVSIDSKEFSNWINNIAHK